MKQPYLDTNGTWRLDDVPVCSTGIEYPLASGPMTFTEEHLQDIVASQGDTAIKVPRLKLGHSSGYNAALVGDAEQAFGRVENLRLGNFNQTVYGDYVGMPEWLAKVLPVAYPSRSIEGWPDVQTNTGKEWRAVVTAVSLLGVCWPGVSTLEDLPLWFGADIPEGAEISDNIKEQMLLSAANGGGMKPGDKIKAAVDIDLVERAFYTEVATGDDYWWWIRGERYDDTTGLQLIVDCDPEARIVRIPVSVSGSDISFGDPVEVTEEYPDKIAAGAFIAGLATAERQTGADVVLFAARADTAPDRPNRIQGGTMNDETRRALATRLGLDPESATEDEINTKLQESALTEDGGNTISNGQEGTGKPDGSKEGLDPTKTYGTENESKGGAPVAGGPPSTTPDKSDLELSEPTIEAGVVKLDVETYERLKRGADDGIAARQAQIKAENDRVLDDAIKAGKFSPARREHYATLLAADPQGTRDLIASLHDGMIPMNERGNAGNSEGEAGGSNDGLLGMDANLDRDIKAARNGSSASGRIVQAREA